MGYAFLSTLSLRRATPAAERLPRCRRNFYPRSPCGERRPAGSVRAARRGGFLSTLSLRRATVLPEASPCTGRDFYPRSPCGERPRPRRRRRRGCYFYPRSPCGERRSSSRSWVVVFLFLSTLSLRRATTIRTPLFSTSTYFYPRSPCGERLCAEHHANSQQEFLSTLSLRRATMSPTSYGGTGVISIHALLAESDYLSNNSRHFLRPFLSTLSLRRATQTNTGSNESGEFLSTLSLRRATSCFAWNCAKCRYFYPRSPCGERLVVSCGCLSFICISIHALLAESDPTPRRTLPARSRFLSTLSLRRATDKDREKALNIALFLSTLSLRRAT